MRLKRTGLFCIVVSVLFLGGVTARLYSAGTGACAAVWKQVRKADGEGLPKTAIKHLDRLIELSRRNADYPWLLKSIVEKIKHQSSTAANPMKKRILLMKKLIKTSVPGIKPMMTVVLARWYWSYYQRYRWRFHGRTATKGLDDEDFTTWDLPRLFREIDRLFQSALKDDAWFKSRKCSDWSVFLEKSQFKEDLRPTLFDLVAFEALLFYESSDYPQSKSADAFEMDASSDAFSGRKRFVDYKPDTPDNESPLVKSIRIYQELIKFHMKRGNLDVLVNTDLLRLRFVLDKSFGANKTDRYLERLEEICSRDASAVPASYAYYQWALTVKKAGDLVKAVQLAGKGAGLHPGSVGAVNCKSLIADIKHRQLDIKTERTLLPGKAKISVGYANIEKIHFRIYRGNWDFFINYRYGVNPDYVDSKEIESLLRRKPLFEWSAGLDKTVDYKLRRVEKTLPRLKKGFYRIIASWRGDFSVERNRSTANSVQAANLWVTDITLFSRTRYGRIEGLVLNALTGEPVQGAQVKAFARKNSRWIHVVTKTTDTLGRYFFNYQEQREGLLLVAEKNGSRCPQSRTYSSYRPSGTRRSLERTLLFTDRGIYRPGQTVLFKGICYRTNQALGIYEVIPGKRLDVSLYDHNGRRISRQELRTNDFGSFNGKFTAPSGTLTGRMSIRVGTPSGSVSFRVEQYKRPKFVVKVNQPENGGTLGKAVIVKGSARSFTGAPIDGAKVKFRVTRKTSWPWWSCFWWYAPPPVPDREIAHGIVKTDAAGNFRLNFEAMPDPKIEESRDPTFTFQVSVDVTDCSGETRSASTSLRLGYKAMEARISVDEWLTVAEPVRIALSTATLDGRPVSARGRIEVYKLLQPGKPVPKPLFTAYGRYWQRDADKSDPTKWQSWKDGDQVAAFDFETDKNGTASVPVRLGAGAYRVRLLSRDRFGKKVSAYKPFIVYDPAARRFPVRIPSVLAVKSSSVEVGERFEALWGTGYDTGRAYIEFEHRNKIIKSFWSGPGMTQRRISFLVKEKFRGGLTLHVTYVRENRLYSYKRRIDVPWSNKKLELTTETFRSVFEPGEKVRWTIKIKGKEAPVNSAELLAALYDASLDTFVSHNWSTFDGVFRRDGSSAYSDPVNTENSFTRIISNWNRSVPGASLSYWSLPDQVVGFGGGFYGFAGCDAMSLCSEGGVCGGAPPRARLRESMTCLKGARPSAPVSMMSKSLNIASAGPPARNKSKSLPALEKVAARKKLGETAFFKPELRCGPDGLVTIEFTAPQALTRWKFMGMAHSKHLESGIVTKTATTRKDLMVRPNAPRFLREKDEIRFSVKVVNMADKAQNGRVRLSFRDAVTGKNFDAALGNRMTDRSFAIPAGQSRSFFWKLKVPVGAPPLLFKAVAASEKRSDGEEGLVPVLSGRVFVTESLPLPVRGPCEKKFRFEKLINSRNSSSISNHCLVVQMVSNPAWYAVQALPYLAEYPHECSEQVFNRLYANLTASYIANSDPKIRRVFEQWRAAGVLKSNLEKNEKLKSVILQETPWVMQAKNEAAAKKKIGLLFNTKRISSETSRAMRKLTDLQLPDGSFPWFPGGDGDTFITLYLLAGFGRLRHLEIDSGFPGLAKAAGFLDQWLLKRYRYLQSRKLLGNNNLDSSIALYMYGRSFFVPEKALSPASRTAFDYYIKQCGKYWLGLSRMSQGHIALALNRMGISTVASKIVASLRERAEHSEEMGMYWNEDASWWWYKAPIETQAVMIEVFHEVAHDRKAVDDCQVWLLKQKQTLRWSTTKATADAVYALLLRGRDLLASDEPVEISLAASIVRPAKVEAGTGFYEKYFNGDRVKPEMGVITVRKKDEGVAWGSVNWQYFEDLDKVTPHKSPLRIEKKIFVQTNTAKGPVIEPVKGRVLHPGDLLKVRIVLRTDRDMEYIHLKDQRGSGTEPINVLSGYKYRDGLSYYESTADTASHFFISYLRKGTYVFEYPLRVVHKGVYQSGMATVQCMYAPEFNSHSESFRLMVTGK